MGEADVLKAGVIAATVLFTYVVVWLATLAITNNNRAMAKTMAIVVTLLGVGFFWAVWGPRLSGK